VTKQSLTLVVWAAAGLAGGFGQAAAQQTMVASARQPVRVQAISFDVSAQPLGDAIAQAAQQADVNVMWWAEVGEGLRAPRLEGMFTPQRAFAALLVNTPLRADFVDEHTVVIRAAATHGDVERSGVSPSQTAADQVNAQERTLLAQEAEQQQRSTSAAVTVLEGQAPKRNDPGSRSTDGDTARQLEQVVVTAQKREERLRDVPMSLTALSGDALSDSHDFRFEDYVGKVPGLALVDSFAWGSQLVIRGITSGHSIENAAVATYVDETPYVVEGPFAGAFVAAPNLDTFDMQRIEVLRGPQGTLYGANALAGLLKYVTNAPDPSRFSVKVATGGNTVENGRQGFDAHGMVNLPVTSDAALRLVGYDTYYPGFIDDPSRGITNINGSRITGGRAAALYSPTPTLSIRLNAFYQKRSYNDWPTMDVAAGSLTPVYGELVHETLIQQSGYLKNQVYNATINWNAGFANLVSATSYLTFDPFVTRELTTLEALVSRVFNAPYGVAFFDHRPAHAFVQEVRLTSNGDAPFQWQLGGFYTNEGSNPFEPALPISVASKTILVPDPLGLGYFASPTQYREVAGFANIGYRITPTLDASVGGRYSHNNQTFHEVTAGALFGVHNFERRSSEGVFTYSGDVRWHFTPDSIVYARVAEGFTPGGPNNTSPTITFLPDSYKSSTLVNYEVGIKASALSGRLTAEVSAFHINWRDIQLAVVVGGISEQANGGTAKSDGVEWSFAYVPLKGLTLDLNGAYTHARLTENSPPGVGGFAGNRLPGSPLLQASAGAEYSHLLSGEYTGFGGVSWRFTGSRYSDFESSSPRQLMPRFNILDLRAGLETQRWSAALYIKNVTDTRAIDYVLDETSLAGRGTQSASIYTPRTVGATLTVTF
jgi:iron complex outermembrane recepter protein